MIPGMAIVAEPKDDVKDVPMPASIFDEDVYAHISEVPGFENATDYERLVLIDRFFLVGTHRLPFLISLGGQTTFAFTRHSDNDRGEEATEAQREDH